MATFTSPFCRRPGVGASAQGKRRNEVDRLLSRRELLKLSAAGVLGASFSGWLEVLAGRAAEATAPGASFIKIRWDSTL